MLATRGSSRSASGNRSSGDTLWSASDSPRSTGPAQNSATSPGKYGHAPDVSVGLLRYVGDFTVRPWTGESMKWACLGWVSS